MVDTCGARWVLEVLGQGWGEHLVECVVFWPLGCASEADAEWYWTLTGIENLKDKYKNGTIEERCLGKTKAGTCRGNPTLRSVSQCSDLVWAVLLSCEMPRQQFRNAVFSSRQVRLFVCFDTASQVQTLSSTPRYSALHDKIFLMLLRELEMRDEGLIK